MAVSIPWALLLKRLGFRHLANRTSLFREGHGLGAILGHSVTNLQLCKVLEDVDVVLVNPQGLLVALDGLIIVAV